MRHAADDLVNGGDGYSGMDERPEISFINAIAEAVAAKLRRDLERPTIALDDLGVELMRVYDVRDTARLLSCSEAAVRHIPEAELPKARRVGTGIGYLGINIMLYSHGLPPIDMTSVLEEYRRSLLRDRPTVEALRPDEQRITRVH